MAVERNSAESHNIAGKIAAKQRERTSTDDQRRKSMHLNIPGRKGMNSAAMYSNSDAVDGLPSDLRSRYVENSTDERD